MNALAGGFLCALVALPLTSAPPTVDPSSTRAQDPELGAEPEDAALAEVRALLEAARRAQVEKDYASAREQILAAIETAFAQIGGREDGPASTLFEELGRFAHDVGELRAAERTWRAVLAVFARTLPDDHPDLQRARLNLAVTIRELGDLARARALEEAVLAVRARTLPDDHPDLQRARLNLAVTIKAQGDLAGARALEEAVLAVRSRTLPDDHPDLAKARLNLAATMQAQGDLAGARALFEAVLAVFARTLSDDHPDLQRARLNLAVTMYAQGDLAGARALLEAVLAVRSRTLPDDHPALQLARQNLAATIKTQGDLAGARALEEAVLAVRERTLPEDHPDLQAARGNLAGTIKAQGDLAGARALEEEVLAVFARTLPDDHPALQIARQNLAVTIRELGDLAGARVLEEVVLALRARTLPDDHPDLQTARGNLAVTIKAQGDLAGARALEEAVLAVFARTLPDDHPHLQAARLNLAATIKTQGDLPGARAFEEEVLAVRARTLPEDHPDLLTARLNLAVTMYAQGDLPGARALEEEVLAVRARTLPEDHPDLQRARQGLAVTMYAQGDLGRARALFEAVLAVFTRTLPEDHPDLQWARGNLAGTIRAQGDLAGARALFEAVLAVFARTLPGDHPDLQAARGNLAATIRDLGDLPGARVLDEAVLAVRARTLPEDHPDLLTARLNLAGTIRAQGDLAGARALEEVVLAVRARTLPDDHPDLQAARLNLAATMYAQGDMAGARTAFEAVLAVRARTLPDDHPDLQAARGNLALTIVRQAARAKGEIVGKGEREGEKEGGGREERRKGGGRTRCAELVGALCQSQVNAAREVLLTSSVREAEERCAGLAESLDKTLSFAEGFGVFEPLEELGYASFVLSETTRGAALASAAILRWAEGEPEYQRLHGEMRAASDALAALAQRGATSEEYHRARTRREEVERELVGLAHELLGDELAGLDFDVDVMSARLGERDAVVGFRRYTRWWIETEAPSGIASGEEFAADQEIGPKSVESLCAFVVRREGAESASATPGASLEIVQLGAIDAIDEAVRGWREAIDAENGRAAAVGDDAPHPLRGVGVSRAAGNDARARGEALRRLLWDPLLPFLGEAERVIVALDDVLHLVPLEALPLDAMDGELGHERLVGDRWPIETRVTLSELLGERSAIDEGDLSAGGALVALGGAAFDSEPVELAEADLAALEEDGSRRDDVAGILRGGAWERGFLPLTHTVLEAREIAALFDEVQACESAALVLEKRKASRSALEEVAPRARYLHVATHGWFAPESIAAWGDVEPLDAQSGLGQRLSGEQAVRGMSPMLLCGLALAGANLPEDALGRVPGLVTAEELSTLDLSHCELAVLSACDTNVGERRAGQGVASLQKALQMAGARSVITSLWKVPDEATRELMLDFYRRIWVEKKPKAQALWEAKQKKRAASDERGEPRYTTRDWAAWVLTGEP